MEKKKNYSQNKIHSATNVSNLNSLSLRLSICLEHFNDSQKNFRACFTGSLFLIPLQHVVALFYYER